MRMTTEETSQLHHANGSSCEQLIPTMNCVPLQSALHQQLQMSPFSICFTPTGALGLGRSHRVNFARVPVCVIDGNSTTTTGTKKRIQSKGEASSSSYEVLPSDLQIDELPPPPPVHWSLPVFGFIVEHWLNIGNPATRAKKYGHIFQSSFMLQQMHHVSEMKTIVDMQRDVETFSSSGTFDPIELVFGKDSMTLLDGAEHAAVRSIVAPAFAPGVFPFYFDSIQERVKKTWARVEDEVINTGKALLDPVFRAHYLSIVVEMTTGIDMDSQKATLIQDRFGILSNAFFSPPFGPIWDNGMKAKSEVIDILDHLVKQNLIDKKDTIEKLREHADNLNNLGSKNIAKGEVNVLLVAIARSGLKTGEGEVNNSEDIRSLTNLMLFLWFAGYATSAVTTSCAVFEMGMNSNIWNLLKAEQDELVAEAGSKTVTYEQVRTRMPLLDSFITEMLRMHPAAPGVIRVATKDLKVLGKYVKAGDKLYLDSYAAMRDPRFFPDPDELKIDRFVRRDGEMPAHKVIAFGGPGSPHYCLGGALAKVLMRTTLSMLLREYRVELDPKQSRNYSIVPDETPISKVIVQGFSKREFDTI